MMCTDNSAIRHCRIEGRANMVASWCKQQGIVKPYGCIKICLLFIGLGTDSSIETLFPVNECLSKVSVDLLPCS
jgi:hypothetical protein